LAELSSLGINFVPFIAGHKKKGKERKNTPKATKRQNSKKEETPKEKKSKSDTPKSGKKGSS